jgi:hypothetical protein
MALSSQSRIAVLVLVGLVACLGLTLAVYWPGLAGSFMLDDNANIGRAYVADPDFESVLYVVTHNDSGLLGRSVSMLSFILTSMEFALDPWGYKYHNLLLHLLNGVLLFRLLQCLLPLLDRRLDEQKALLIAGVTAALWLLHPLLVSTVLYAVQRMTQLSALFTLLALLAWIKARTSTNLLRFCVFGWCLFPLMAVLAVLSKENGALIPLYVLAIELLAFRTRLPDLRQGRRLAVACFTFILLPLLLSALILLLKWDSITEYSGRTFTMAERLLTEVHAIGFYVRLIFLPRLRTMSLFHDDYPITSSFDISTLSLLVLMAAVVALAWRIRHTWAPVAFGIAWFLASHLMESTVLPLELVFEHRNYLASAGLLLIPVHAVFVAELTKPLRLLCPVFIAMFAFMTMARAREWGDDEVFHRIAVEEHPTSGRALNSYINYLTQKGDYAATLAQLETLVALTPDELGVHLHMQSIKCSAKIHDDAALAAARDLAGRMPTSVYGYNAMQNLLLLIVGGHCPVVAVDEVEPIVNAAIRFATDSNAEERLSVLLRLRGIIALTRGYYAQGYSDYRTAHEMTGDITVLHELMRYQLERGEIGDAEDTLALMEEQNARRFGLEEHQLRSTREMLERSRRARDQALQPTQKPGATPEIEAGTNAGP